MVIYLTLMVLVLMEGRPLGVFRRHLVVTGIKTELELRNMWLILVLIGLKNKYVSLEFSTYRSVVQNSVKHELLAWFLIEYKC